MVEAGTPIDKKDVMGYTPFLEAFCNRYSPRYREELHDIYSFWRWGIEHGIDIVRAHKVYHFGRISQSPATELLHLLWYEKLDLGLPQESQEFLTFLVNHLHGKEYDKATARYLKYFAEPFSKRKAKW
ncbi:uncharacterized protein BDZ99DRAFT_519434 [Mytilinidion resinicola]|uniref:Uncharacterized protein n=1 Tax=Mytilinidion resinicola TaxID=574789 RepID=A0A6A6YPS4_9PEZI|nr:uncharacterized protein BDZ99DRAFT_519434 [Mytilinidion resinicola]KAF2810751.1 hypothetical protein BDZ99DRAFT_519434 [Mytilinidion resinicola]